MSTTRMPSSLELDEARDLETASSGGDDDSEYDAPSRARFERTRATFRRSAARKYSACGARASLGLFVIFLDTIARYE